MFTKKQIILKNERFPRQETKTNERSQNNQIGDDDFRKIENTYCVQEITKNNSLLIFRKNEIIKKKLQPGIDNNNNNNNSNSNYLEIFRGKPKKSNVYSSKYHLTESNEKLVCSPYKLINNHSNNNNKYNNTATNNNENKHTKKYFQNLTEANEPKELNRYIEIKQNEQKQQQQQPLYNKQRIKHHFESQKMRKIHKIKKKKIAQNKGELISHLTESQENNVRKAFKLELKEKKDENLKKNEKKIKFLKMGGLSIDDLFDLDYKFKQPPPKKRNSELFVRNSCKHINERNIDNIINSLKTGKIISNSKSNCNLNTNEPSSRNSGEKKNISLKPKIDSFEYLQKIKISFSPIKDQEKSPTNKNNVNNIIVQNKNNSKEKSSQHNNIKKKKIKKNNTDSHISTIKNSIMNLNNSNSNNSINTNIHNINNNINTNNIIIINNIHNDSNSNNENNSNKNNNKNINNEYFNNIDQNINQNNNNNQNNSDNNIIFNNNIPNNSNKSNNSANQNNAIDTNINANYLKARKHKLFEEITKRTKTEIINYIKSKKKERKEKDLQIQQKTEDVKQKKFRNFYLLQNNILKSLKNSISSNNTNNNLNPNGNCLLRKKHQKPDSTVKSSVINDQEYYISCYESQKIISYNLFRKRNNSSNNMLIKPLYNNYISNQYRKTNHSSSNNKYRINKDDILQIEKTLKKSHEIFDVINERKTIKNSKDCYLFNNLNTYSNNKNSNLQKSDSAHDFENGGYFSDIKKVEKKKILPYSNNSNSDNNFWNKNSHSIDSLKINRANPTTNNIEKYTYMKKYINYLHKHLLKLIEIIIKIQRINFFQKLLNLYHLSTFYEAHIKKLEIILRKRTFKKLFIFQRKKKTILFVSKLSNIFRKKVIYELKKVAEFKKSFLLELNSFLRLIFFVCFIKKVTYYILYKDNNNICCHNRNRNKNRSDLNNQGSSMIFDMSVDSESLTVKNKTFLYETQSEKSSLSIFPNSEGNDRLHSIREILLSQRELLAKLKKTKQKKQLYLSLKKEKEKERNSNKCIDIDDEDENIGFSHERNLNKIPNNVKMRINNKNFFDKFKEDINKSNNSNNSNKSNNSNNNNNQDMNNQGWSNNNDINDNNDDDNKLVKEITIENELLSLNEDNEYNNLKKYIDLNMAGNKCKNKNTNNQNINQPSSSSNNSNNISVIVNDNKEKEGKEEKEEKEKISSYNDNNFCNLNINIKLKNNSIKNQNIINDRYNSNIFLSKKNNIKKDNNNDDKDKEKEKEEKNNMEENKIINQIDQKLTQFFDNLSFHKEKNFTDDIVNEILKEFMESEMQKNILELEKKNNYFNNNNINKENNNSTKSNKDNEIKNDNKLKQSNNSNNSNLNNPNNTSLDSSMNTSIFLKTIKEKKNQKIFDHYQTKTFPILMEKIINNIKKNYPKIISNLKEPKKIDEIGLMTQMEQLIEESNDPDNFFNDNLFFNDEDDIDKEEPLLRLKIPYININDNNNNTKINNTKNTIPNNFSKNNYSIAPFIDKEILNEFSIIEEGGENDEGGIDSNDSNKKSNKISIYESYLNKCIYDTTNYIIESKRMHGNIGEPFSWSNIRRDILFKYDNDNYSKKYFILDIMKSLKRIMKQKIGILAEKLQYFEPELLIEKRNDKFIENIKEDLEEEKEKDEFFYDIPRTYIKLSLSKLVMNQLINEVIIILDSVQVSRASNSKYQNKSIYSYENNPIFNMENIPWNQEDEDEIEDNPNQ